MARNKNNTNISTLYTHNLTCINIDDTVWLNLNWTNIDNWTIFSNYFDAISDI